MAIYTNYARYLKAKEFKKMIEDQGDTYMLLGLGNPFWDSIVENAVAKMPVAPYNTSIMKAGIFTENQFFDGECHQSFISATRVEGGSGYSGITVDDRMDHSNPSSGVYIDLVKKCLPPFPCSWEDDSTNPRVIYSSNNVNIALGALKSYFIDPNTKHLYGPGAGDSVHDYGVEELPLGDSQESIVYRQAYADMYLRGMALANGIIHPVGLLGAVRCNVNFVKDLGADESAYIGAVNQIWYGDRFWQILDSDPLDETPIEEYLKENDDLPHHLLFNATINPMQLAPELKIDQNIVPRHIAIFVRHRDDRAENELVDDEQQPVLKHDPPGKKYYPVNGTTIFNFGQYHYTETRDDHDQVTISWPNLPDKLPAGYTDDPEHPYSNATEYWLDHMLNFTLPVKTSDGKIYPDGEFKFILNDYIKGSVRDKHSIDRIGYVLGF